MKAEKIKVGKIPAIVWGEESDRAYIFVHGKESKKEYAAPFAALAEEKGYQVISFDLPEHGERTDGERCDVWCGKRDIEEIYDYSKSRWSHLSLFACSIGAYFSLNALDEKKIEKALFQSPIVDLRSLTEDMMLWFGVSKERLEKEKEIETPIDVLRLDYYNYIVSHPIEKWSVPTAVLYGGRDNLQTREVVSRFCERFCARLTVEEDCEHPFMAEGDEKILEKWYRENI